MAKFIGRILSAGCTQALRDVDTDVYENLENYAFLAWFTICERHSEGRAETQKPDEIHGRVCVTLFKGVETSTLEAVGDI